ncbi:hypothetical protein [Thiocystis violascens]|uniref:Uncharacterized protein n=1 Tax=Thiocystis violascens (strain ATCC 17096 / DSM 198 / 6111) TaxID=765911 RepID=I3YFL7_THIV6|nr:hypothetical protein [Thiocystis violascens]AFL75785.1 hypothetical protein Thivi_3950 [Thiocystis violascens DSM 198]
MDWPGPFDPRPTARRRAAPDQVRPCAYILWLLVLAASLPARAQEPVLARVLTIEVDRVTLSVPDGASGENARVGVAIDRSDLPPDLVNALEPGRLVRLWPGAAPDASGLSAGARLDPLDRGASIADRTGVRSRLMRGAARGGGRGSGGGRGGR